MAFAGVGTPMKEVVCRVSRLNLANRKAEKAAMRNAVYGIYASKGIRNVGVCTSLNKEKMMNAGATPKLTLSANESSSFPIVE